MGTVLFETGASRDRTGDLLHAMQALSQLSYSPDRERGDSMKQADVCQLKLTKFLKKYFLSLTYQV